MSGASKGRKSKNVRPGSKKNSSQNQSPPYEGAYGNARLVHVLLSLVGKKCQAKVKNGGSYEGVFHTFNPKMDVALNVVHKCDKMLNHNPTTNGIDSNEGNDCPKEEELIEEMLFPSESLVSASFEDVDMSFATLEVNETNGESSSLQRSNFKSGEKKLEPWNGGGDTDPLTIGGLEGGLGSDGTNGWGADEMFRANEEKYGVKSDYDSSLSNYTMQLDMKETNEDSIARATRLAQEIESGSDYKRRIDLELDDGRTEEDKFSAVRDSRKDRGSREMRDRDRRDMRDGGEGGYHDKDRGDRERDRDRDHLTSPQGYRKHDYERSHIPGRNRGRGRDSWDKRNQQGFTGSNMGPHRSMGGPGGQSGGGGRNQPPMSPMDGPPGQGGSQGKYRGSSSGQTHLPPRFTKTGSGGHSREEERMRQNDNNAMHSPYQPPKGQRQPRMQRSNMGRQPAWGGPTSPPADYPHHSPTQMHQDPAVISSGPASGVGGPPLSRSSSNSSNTSTPVQNHRKHLSTSSQEEQPTPQHPPTQQHHQHLRQISSSSSPTGGPLVNNNQQQQQSARPPPQGMPPTAVPGTDGGVPGHSWASIASRNPAKQQMGHGMSEMGLSHMGQGSSSGIPQQSPRSRMPGIVSVRSNATYTYTPRGGTPPTSSMPTPYPPSGTQSMNQQMPNMGSPRVHPNTQQMHPMGADHMPGPGQMIPRGPPPQQMVPSPPQQQAIQQMPTMQGQHGPRPSQPQAMKTSISPENAQKHSEKAEMMKKPAEQPQTQPTGGKISQLKDFAEKFKLPTDVKKESTNQSSVATTQSVNKVPQQQQQQQRPPPNMGQPPPQTMNRPQPYPNPAHQQQHPYPSPQQQHPQQSYVGPMGPQDHGAAMQHGMPQNAGPVPGNVMLQQPKHQTHPGVVNQMHSHPQQMSHVQIPVAAPSIQQFSAPVPSPQHPAMQPMSRPMDSPKMMPNRMMQPVDKNIPPVQQKPLTSAKVEVSNFQHNANIHVVTGPPVSQANPSAVITVSAANSSPIVSSHYQVPAIPTTQIAQPQRQSPTAAQVGQPSSSPTIEPSTTPVPSSQHSANTSITSPTAGIKALNPEAQEFKPRTPAKPSPIATRATTPQAQMPIYAFVQAPVASGMGPQTPTQIATPVYNAAPMPPMHADMQQIYHTQFPQQYIPVQMPGQQFAFDQNGQPVYASPAPQQAMMAQNARMAATIPGTPQQHIQQYQSDQGPAPVYVPVAPQGSNFMQQRPHSAHTPTQVTHVTASSPATQSTQQTQQPTGHPAMVPAHGVQQGGGPVWMPINANSNIMMVPSGQPQPMQMNQPPQHTHYLSAMPTGQIPSSVAMSNPVQQKGQQQQIPAGHYMAQTPQRSYGQYQSPSANNQ